MKNWSPHTYILFAGLAFVAVAGNFGWTYDPLRPHDSPRQSVIKVDDLRPPRNLDGDPRLSEQARTHIIENHHHSAGIPCKTEFPEDWDEEKVISVVKKLAANDNAPWRQEENGYYVADQPYETLDIRVVLDEEGDDIVTAYPTNLPRNPCYR